MATGVLGVFFFITDSVVLGEGFICICLGGEGLIVSIAAGPAFCSRGCLLCFIPVHVLGWVCFYFLCTRSDTWGIVHTGIICRYEQADKDRCLRAWNNGFHHVSCCFIANLVSALFRGVVLVSSRRVTGSTMQRSWVLDRR